MIKAAYFTAAEASAEIFDFDTNLLQSAEPDLTGYEGV